MFDPFADASEPEFAPKGHGSDASSASGAELPANLVGMVGEVVKPLMSVGQIMIDQVRVPAISRQGFLPVGTTVMVVGQKMQYWVVEAYAAEE